MKRIQGIYHMLILERISRVEAQLHVCCPFIPQWQVTVRHYYEDNEESVETHFLITRCHS